MASLMVINKNVREENLARKLKGICLNSDIWNMSAMKSDVLIPNNVVNGEILFIYAKQLLFRYKQFFLLCTFVIVSELLTIVDHLKSDIIMLTVCMTSSFKEYYMDSCVTPCNSSFLHPCRYLECVLEHSNSLKVYGAPKSEQ